MNSESIGLGITAFATVLVQAGEALGKLLRKMMDSDTHRTPVSH